MRTEINLPSVIGRGYASFWKTKKRYRVVKGGRGSKKSTTAAMWFIYNIMKHPKANALVVRKTYNTHKDSTYAQLKWAASNLGVSEYWRFTLSPLEAIYTPTGQKIIFRGFDDPLKLTSMTVNVGKLCWVWLEEAYEIENESDFDTLDESIRGEMPSGLWKQITITFNPWVNSHWTKSRFFDKEFPDSFTLTTTYKCNEWLDQGDRKRIEDLEFTNPDRFKVVGLGEYGIPGGTFFDEFRTDVHVIEPFPIPSHWQRYRVLDYGLDMLAHYWVAIDTKGYAYFYKELYESDLIISEAAKRIAGMTIESIRITYAPPDLWNRRQETGKSARDLFLENGVLLSKASNDRVQGWLNVKEWLKPFKTRDEHTGEEITTARLKIFKNCINLIRTIPQLQRDEKDPNDVATEPHEITHAPDAVRYFCSMRTVPTRVEKKALDGFYTDAELEDLGYKQKEIKKVK
ncbi:PBSX family phage terminase large subunit [Paenibacillus contaminans]|uniref:PBSX family phage terminase large subunit n=1 Tax=Paenibacillus contaminans TaxID=450362 RepID=A0A329MU22_9BACL|nr:PBSX family phage terminase large subunit [Paenibacillus contaminans]RAV22213.1 PBSX family phage terminase large subunit [Paenibacillus contaminans]